MTFTLLALFFGLTVASNTLHANNFEQLHGKLQFSVQVDFDGRPSVNSKVEVFMNGKIVVQALTNAQGTASLEIGNYLHELVNIRVSKEGFASREVRGVSLFANRVYAIGLGAGEGLEIILGEQELEKIQIEEKSRLKRQELDNSIKEKQGNPGNKENLMQDKAKQSSKELSEQTKGNQAGQQQPQVNSSNKEMSRKERRREKKAKGDK